MSAPYYSDYGVTVYSGDCYDPRFDPPRGVLTGLADASVGAVVTDPPYELAFMGRRWDASGIAFNPAMWRQCLRVLKPGGYLLAFGGSRTWHRLAAAVEDAGFEIRDSIAWLYASGFPKSSSPYRRLVPCRSIEHAPPAVRVSEWHPLDSPAAKAPTALALVETQPGGDLAVLIRTGEEDGSSDLTVTSWSEWTDGTSWNTVSSWNDYSAESWRRTSMSITSTMIEATTDPRTSKSCTSLLTAASTRASASHLHGCGCVVATAATRSIDGSWSFNDTPTLIAPEAVIAPLAPLRGLGTALKPGFEPIVVARKPLAGTVAANVLEHGVGALNIDACRVATDDDMRRTRNTALGVMNDDGWQPKRQESDGHAAGRWPSNVVLTHAATPDGEDLCGDGCVPGCPVHELDEQAGVRTSGANPTRRGTDKFRDAYGDFRGQAECEPARGADSGAASRFYPVFRFEAKAPAAERPRVDGVAHPTVKPLALMRWLVRLVTPPGGLVLDPFGGSGTTGQACRAEGFECVLIERDETYLPLIRARLDGDGGPDLFGGAA